MPHQVQLTSALSQQIVAAIRAGADPRDAAQTFDVPRAVFDAWLALGESDEAVEPFRTFAAEVRTARGQARTRAEIAIFQKLPRIWLEDGPGNTDADATINVLEHPSFLDAARALLEALRPFPEARAHAARALFNLPTPFSRGEAHAQQEPKNFVAETLQPGSGSAVA